MDRELRYEPGCIVAELTTLPGLLVTVAVIVGRSSLLGETKGRSSSGLVDSVAPRTHKLQVVRVLVRFHRSRRTSL